MSTQKKRIYAPAALAVGMIIVAVVGLIAIGFQFGIQTGQHSRVGGGILEGVKSSSSQAVDIDQLREELTQGRLG